jgi:dGTPase
VQYSSAFARLAEVTQVVSADRGYVFHNRLTHSLKVAQLARRISEKLRSEQPLEAAALGGPDPDVAEAAALAHDLGHPPFGHIAEVELDELARSAGLADGFEGNAQSFRIVSKLAVSDAISADTDKTPVIRGLNLTRATLNAILKYPWLHGDNPAKKHKWGAYETERKLFQWVRDGHMFDRFSKSVEAAIMDWSDDITYAVHDLVDFYCAGQIPLDRLPTTMIQPNGTVFSLKFLRDVRTWRHGVQSSRTFSKKRSISFRSIAAMSERWSSAPESGSSPRC